MCCLGQSPGGVLAIQNHRPSILQPRGQPWAGAGGTDGSCELYRGIAGHMPDGSEADLASLVLRCPAGADDEKAPSIAARFGACRSFTARRDVHIKVQNAARCTAEKRRRSCNHPRPQTFRRCQTWQEVMLLRFLSTLMASPVWRRLPKSQSRVIRETWQQSMSDVTYPLAHSVIGTPSCHRRRCFSLATAGSGRPGC